MIYSMPARTPLCVDSAVSVKQRSGVSPSVCLSVCVPHDDVHRYSTTLQSYHRLMVTGRALFLARDVIYTSRVYAIRCKCPSVCPSVCDGSALAHYS